MPAAVLTQKQQKVLELLVPIVHDHQFYLAGGTALALHMGHRRSVDFDFFTAQQFDPLTILQRLPQCEIRQQTSGTLTVEIDSVQTSFFEFTYPLLEPLERGALVPMAHIADIAAMKVSAIAGRGSRKDFIDLYIITQRKYSLQECLSIFAKKFRTTKTDVYHIMRSVTYFEDAEREIMPEMLIECDWESIKQFFVTEVKKLQ
ncbi:MAG: nucleotidyl transferase AbiEii/AbiGii toxin family protein [Bacteroidota bacterium]